MPDANNVIEQVREKANKKAVECERKDIEERAMEYLNDRVSADVKRIVVKDAEKHIEKNIDNLIREELLNQRIEKIQQLIAEDTMEYIKDCVSKQIDEKTEEYAQKEAKEQSLKVARDSKVYK